MQFSYFVHVLAIASRPPAMRIAAAGRSVTPQRHGKRDQRGAPNDAIDACRAKRPSGRDQRRSSILPTTTRSRTRSQAHKRPLLDLILHVANLLLTRRLQIIGERGDALAHRVQLRLGSVGGIALQRADEDADVFP
jgi:hypothetical protein